MVVEGASANDSPLPVGRARSLLLTVLNEFVRPDRAPVWTAALLHVPRQLGVEDSTTRQTLARVADAGLILGEKRGRLVRWTLTDDGVRTLDEVTRRVLSLSIPPATWDGACLVVAVTIPHTQRTARKRLYSALNWAGFGNVAPGVWASPHVDRATEIKRVIEELGLRDSTIAFVGRTASLGLTDQEIVRRAWTLDAIAARYQEMIDTFDGLTPEPGDEVLRTYIALVNAWREFPLMDPQLPKDLLPDWIGRRAVRMSLRLQRRWRPGARQRWAEIADVQDPTE
jgi:phenylacetic acid degradation operon negative regulatory protein